MYKYIVSNSDIIISNKNIPLLIIEIIIMIMILKINFNGYINYYIKSK